MYMYTQYGEKEHLDVLRALLSVASSTNNNGNPCLHVPGQKDLQWPSYSHSSSSQMVEQSSERRVIGSRKTSVIQFVPETILSSDIYKEANHKKGFFFNRIILAYYTVSFWLTVFRSNCIFSFNRRMWSRNLYIMRARNMETRMKR